MTQLSSTTLWTALVTPLNEDGTLDLLSFKKLLRMQEAAGNGVLILGSTGEGSNLTIGQREQLVEFTCQQNLSVPIMVGVGGLDLQAQLAWIRYLELWPIDAYLLVTPIYAKPGAAGQAGWFNALMDASSRRCMLYNIPGRAGVPLVDGAIERVQNHPNCWAVKESGGNPARFAQLVKDFPTLQWFSGDDDNFADHCALGAVGLVSVASNVWPKKVADWVAEGLTNKAFDNRLAQAAAPLFSAPNPIPTKALLADKKVIRTATVQLPLSLEDLESLEPLRTIDAVVTGVSTGVSESVAA
ncbi:4-hydroxy-tetrahydrodipicolinate synthase [Salinibius halmophilus]|uniref:4-hydroxy-tetrahydrodipicolinate synthase n=1 Tax=Salinibius halmophilus TaxID=1853216 RepID=UPI000E66842A|nr:4-hydroxy-tetrahydrodipicolinate synthase [Salinibius halmophilus]